MEQTRSLSTQESKVVLALTERRQREVTRAEIVELLGSNAKAADHVIEALRRKGWLERATWENISSYPPSKGRMPSATATFWRSPAASPILITSVLAPPLPTTA
jgi:hypothetical protein